MVLLLLQELQREFGLCLYLYFSQPAGGVAIGHTYCRGARGQFVELGPAEQLLRRPGHAYTRELLAAVPQLLRA